MTTKLDIAICLCNNLDNHAMKSFSLILLAALLFNGLAIAKKSLIRFEKMAIEEVATWISKQLKVSTTVAVLYCKEDARLSGLVDAFVKKFTALGGDVNVQHGYSIPSIQDMVNEDFIAQLHDSGAIDKVINTNPDVVILTSPDSDSSTIATELRKAGYEGSIIGDFVGADTLEPEHRNNEPMEGIGSTSPTLNRPDNVTFIPGFVPDIPLKVVD